MKFWEIEKSDKNILLASDVAECIGADPQDIRDQAHRDPSKLGFPVIVTGTRVKIPREGFLHFMKYGYGIGENHE